MSHPPVDPITNAVSEVAVSLGRLLELILSRASVQAASVVTPLIERQQIIAQRQDRHAAEIGDLHRRLDTRSEQIDAQEERITALEREVGRTE